MTHPVRGTCNDSSCEYHNLCHCGCGEQAAICHWNKPASGRFEGQPHIFKIGHRTHGVVAPWHAHGVEIERLRPLAQFMVKRYGADRAAEIVGIPGGTMSNLAYSHRLRRTSPVHARLLIQAVMAHKRPQDPWADYETVRLPSTERDNDQSKDARRQKDRLHKRKVRAEYGDVSLSQPSPRRPAEVTGS